MDNRLPTFQMTLALLSSGSCGPTGVGFLGLFTLSLKALHYPPNDMLLQPRRIQSLLLFIACLRLQSRDVRCAVSFRLCTTKTSIVFTLIHKSTAGRTVRWQPRLGMEKWGLVESSTEHSWERDSWGVLKVEWQLNETRWVSVLVNLGLIWDEWLEQKSFHFISVTLELICFILEEFRNTGKLLHLNFFEKRMNIYYVWLCVSGKPHMNYIYDKKCSSYIVLNIHSSVKTSFMQ